MKSTRHSSWSTAFAIAAMLGCEKTPQEVFVPATAQKVKLVVTASTTHLAAGDSAVFSAERWNTGEWKKVSTKELSADQCWMVNPPESFEEEVADNLRWEISPREGVRLNAGFRSDHTREVIFEKPGIYVVRSSSKVPCRPNFVAEGKPITMVVSEAIHQGETER